MAWSASPVPAVTGPAGEREILRRTAHLLDGSGREAGISVPIGDDAAVVTLSGEAVLTCDALVEDTHFTLATHTPADLGHKSLAVNLSDIAAMGAEPRYCLVSLVLRGNLGFEFIEEYYSGLLPLAREMGTAVVGGNLARTAGQLVIDVTVAGQVPSGGALVLSGARPGDHIMVTGTLGDSAAGLALLSQDPARARRGPACEAVAAHLRPMPRVSEGLALARCGLRPSALTDISDGLAEEIAIMCRASGTGAIIDSASIPVSRACREAAATLGADAITWALTGGEDYELVFTAGPKEARLIAGAVSRATGTPVTSVGEIRPAEHGLRLALDGGEIPLPRGYDHF